MRQLLFDFGSGELSLSALPVGEPAPGMCRVRVHSSVISTGTEQMLLAFGTSSWLERARAQPERVRQVLERVQSAGVFAALDAVQGRLNTPLPLGYASAGEVIAVGAGVTAWAVGDRVACNGPHADVVHVSERLCARIPDSVSYEEAAFTTLGAIALHSTRLACVELGERVLVQGLGLLGCLVVQILQAAGCEVQGVEPRAERAESARERYGIKVSAPEDMARGGYDAVIVCVSAKGASALEQAVSLCRKRGRVVLVGTGEIKLPRALMYEREVTLQVASSYGPGRYERRYEEQGVDYPVEHVRWTAQRNFQAVLTMLASKRLNVTDLIAQRAPFSQAATLYANLLKPDAAPLVMALDYGVPHDDVIEQSSSVRLKAPEKSGELGLGVIGSGVYAQRTFLPALHGVRRVGLVSRGGATSGWVGERHGFEWVGTQSASLIAHEDVEMVAILTRHDTHAELATRALQAGKHVFVEKPLARRYDELDEVMNAARARPELMLAVGYNRRFAPMTQALREAMKRLDAPKTVMITVNAGALPKSHWLHDAEQGGRVLGEACHFVDLAHALIGARVVRVSAQRAGPQDDPGAVISLGFEDGSTAMIAYLTDGPAQLMKERVEVFCAQRSAVIEGWKRLRVIHWPGLKPMRTLKADKGHQEMLRQCMAAPTHGTPAVRLDDVEHVSRVVIEVAQCLV